MANIIQRRQSSFKSRLAVERIRSSLKAPKSQKRQEFDG
jgi:hypothetical protein